jgi:hypothetical protein
MEMWPCFQSLDWWDPVKIDIIPLLLIKVFFQRHNLIIAYIPPAARIVYRIDGIKVAPTDLIDCCRAYRLVRGLLLY